MFAGAVLVIVVLYWAQAVFVPIALAALLSFVLVAAGQLARTVAGPRPGRAHGGDAGVRRARSRRLGSGAADEQPGRGLARVTASTSWRRSTTCAAPARAAPSRSCKRRSTRSRRTSARPMRRQGRAPQQVIVAPGSASGIPGFTWLGPLMGPLGTAGLVVALVIFMLLERRDLRDRLIGLIGRRPPDRHDQGVR